MKIRLKVLLLILFFLLLYSIYYWGIPAFINIENKTPEIQNFIKKNFGAKVRLENPKLKMGLIPSIWLDASYFGIDDKKESPFYITNPKIKIKLIPLLFGKVNLSYLSCGTLKADLRIDKDFRVYLGDHLFIKASNPKISIENSKMDINGYKINIKDEIQNKNIIVDGKYLLLKDYNSKKHINFSTNSQIKINKRISVIDADIDFKLPFKQSLSTNELIFDGSIENLNLNDFSPYIKRLSKNKINQINGILDIEADTKKVKRKTNKITSEMVINNFSIVMDNKSTSISFKDKLKLKTIMNISPNLLSINEFNILSGNIHTKTSGKIKNIGSKTPYIDVNTKVEKSRTEDFISLLPNKNIPNVEVNIPALKKYGYYSDVQGNLRIKGYFDKPDITGELISTNAYIATPLDIPKATAKVKFLGKEIYIDVLVPMGNKQHITVKGKIELYNKKNAKLDIKSSQNVDLKKIKAILDPLHEIFNFDIGPMPVMQLAGTGNINLKTAGNRKNPKLWGVLNFKNANGSFDGVNAAIENFDGSLHFNNQDTHFTTEKAFLNNKPVQIDGKCSLSGDLDFNIKSDSQPSNKIINIVKTSPKFSDIQKDIPSINNVSGKLDIDINLKGKVKNPEDFELGKNVAVSGTIKLTENNLSVSDINFPISNLSGIINFKDKDADFDLYSSLDKSKIHVKGKVKNNAVYSKIKLDDIKFNYFDIPVKIFSGHAEINNNKLILYRVNGLVDSMPILVDGFITDIFKNPNFNLYINSKPNQEFIDKYVNKNAIYPLKTKGDIIYSSRINGTKDSFDTKTEINLKEDSYIYYMGSTLGNVNNPIRIFLDANIAKNLISINNFQYDKLISSQNNKEFISQQLNASGQINVNKNNVTFKNFRIKTQNPTDSRVFNIVFRKSLIKEGVFTSNIIINGSLTSPKILGDLNFTGINIPLLNTTIKDILLNFKSKNIEIKTKGEIFSNKIVFFANMKNDFTPPYVLKDVDIYLGNLDINEIVKTINKLDLESNVSLPDKTTNFDIKDLTIKNGKIKAESVFVKTIFAKNFYSDFSLNEKLLFSLDNFKFNVAEGNIEGDYKHNLLNSKTELNIVVENANANAIAESLFDLPNQIFGLLSGQANLTCNGKTHKTCMSTLTGKGGFRVIDGKMPKLGSMEYLLKAANLVKSGITGLTINSILDLITPLKTGQFENINGIFTVESGFANDIQIFSKGEDLSLFLTGTYNFSNLIANMKIFGRISKKISNVLGPFGNTSLNTLFNTIPGVNLDETDKTDFIKNLNKIPGFELNDKKYRIFSVEVYGDINGDDYVKSFKWVE